MARKNTKAKRQADKLRKQKSRLQILESFKYIPLSNAWRNRQLQELGIPVRLPEMDIQDALQELPLTPPSAVRPIIGDGNCLFRALSYALTESEDYHQNIRLAISHYIRTNSANIRYILPDNVNGDAELYLNSTRMEMDGTWGTEVEIMTAAVILNVNVFVYSKSGVHWRWIRHCPNNIDAHQGIYLFHKNGNHFEAVLAVENSRITQHVLPGQYYSLFEEFKENYKQRQRNSAKKIMSHKYKNKTKSSRKKDTDRLQDTIKRIYKNYRKVRRNILKKKKERYATDSSFSKRAKQMSKDRYNKNAFYRNSKKVGIVFRYYTNNVLRNTLRNLSKQKYATNADFRSKVKKSSKEKYATNADFRSKVKKSSKEKYATNADFGSKVKKSSKEKYATNADFRSKVKKSSKEKYATNADFGSKLKKSSKEKYATNADFRSKVKKSSKEKYATNADFGSKVKKSSKEKYATNADFRSKVKKSSKEKYATNADFGCKVKKSSKEKYATNADFRSKVKKSSKEKYATNADFGSKVKKSSKEKYATNADFRSKVKKSSKEKYATNADFGCKVKKSSKEKYATNADFRSKVKKSSKEKYATNADFGSKVKKSSKEKYATNADFRSKVKKSSKEKYATNADFRSKVKKSSKEKYATNANFINTVKKASKDKYATNVAFKKNVQSYSRNKYQRFSSFRNKVKASSIKKYGSNPLFRLSLRQHLKQQYHGSDVVKQQKKDRMKNARKSVSYSIKMFKKGIKDTPKYICRICIRLLYRKQVKRYTEKRFYIKGTQQLNDAAEKCMNAVFSHICVDICPPNCWMKLLMKENTWMCHTCDHYLKLGYMPPQAVANNLHLLPIPEDLAKLNALERQLISLRIAFMKMLSLPRGGQKGVKGPIVNVPSDITSVTSALPRNINDAQLVKVKLKRKTSYKGHYSFQWINPTNVINAINYLKDHNSWYENVTIDEAWLEENKDVDLIQPEEQHNVDDTSDDGDNSLEHDEHLDKDDENAASTENRSLPVESCFQPINIGQEMLDTNETLCIAPAEKNIPQNIFTEEGSEAMAFPTLLPDGHFGLFHQREIKLSPSKYFNARLLSADSRFSTNKEYLFFAQYLTEINRITSNMSLALRKGKQTTEDGRPVTASMLTNSEHIQDILKSDIGFRFLQPVRGTPPYWQRTMKDLFSMIHQLGIPTWFVTFSAAETRWPDVINTLLFVTNDDRNTEEVEWTEKCSLIAENPLLCARMFDHRVKTLFADLIMSPSHPLGKVLDYFFRTEFQQRGSPHIHCILWIENAPKLGVNSDEEVCHFIDKYVTCKMPDSNTDPELFDIISNVQVHSKSHSNSCRKYGSACRFNFPRPPIRKTFIAKVESKDELKDAKEPTTVEELDDICKTNSRNPKQVLAEIYSLVSSADETGFSFKQILKLANVTYLEFKQCLIDVATRNTVHIKRDLSDAWVNNYNEVLSRAWNANLDIQYVTDAYACVAYILSYISKAETEMGDLLQNAQKEAADGNMDASAALKKIGSAYMQNREVSAQEAVYRVCGFHLKHCTRNVVFIPAGSNIFRMSLPISVVQSKSKKDEDDSDIWMVSVHEKYYNRPVLPEFDDLCLAEFVSRYSFLSKSQAPKSKSSLQVYELQNDLGIIRERKKRKEAVVRYPKFKKDKNPEDYFLSLAQLFLPHRSAVVIPDGFASLEDFVMNSSINGLKAIDVIERNRHKFECNSQELDQAWEDFKEGRVSEDSWGSIAPEAEAERLELEMERECEVTDEPEEIPEFHSNDKPANESSGFHYEPPKVSHQEIQNSLRSMNKTQQDVFYKIKEWCLKVTRKQKPDPFFLFLNGGAGTGKSHLIRCIYHEATRILSKSTASPDSTSVLLMAPTGTAAFNIQGMTVHSGFVVNKKATLPYQPLGENLLNTLRSKYDNLQILIVDEISMVDQKILKYINGRLSQIKHCKNPFGNVSVLAVGDFYQLPPVKGLALYKKRDLDFVNLWSDYFSIVTLTEVMRQKDDQMFAHMLNRLRTHIRGEPLLPEDMEALTKVSVTETPAEALDALHIFPTNREVHEHNIKMLRKKCRFTETSTAEDFYTDVVTGRTKQRDQPYVSCTPEDLQTVLEVGIGARVMLTRNVNTEDGLVNGAFGSIISIDVDNSKQVTAVHIKFDNNRIGQKTMKKQIVTQHNLKGTVRIKKFVDVLCGKKVSRKQLPLKLAWGSTIHKVQGMTVDQIVVSLKNIFQPGMAYVALSRATSLSGLHILNFDPDTIYSNNSITEAINVMPMFLQSNESTPIQSSDSFEIVMHNTEGLLPHLQDIHASNHLNHADVICFTETWLSAKQYIPEHLFPDHIIYSASRSESYNTDQPFKQSGRGGVAMFVSKKHLQKKCMLQSENLEVVSAYVNTALVVTIYRPPTYALQLFDVRLRRLLQEVKQLKCPSIIVGDFNTNVLEPSELHVMKAFQEFGYKQLVDVPTTEGGTCLDLVFVCGFQNACKIRVLPTYYSYHDAVQVLVEQEDSRIQL